MTGQCETKACVDGPGQDSGGRDVWMVQEKREAGGKSRSREGWEGIKV